MRSTVTILGIPIDRLTLAESVEHIDQFIREGGFHQVATANTDFLVNAHFDEELRTILQSADLLTPDGMPLVWAARILRRLLPDRVAGVDLVPELAAMAADRGYRLFLLGARQDVASQAADNLKMKYHSLQIVGCASPADIELHDPDMLTGLLDDTRAASPELLLVAFGNPKQEKWIYRNRAELQSVAVCIGVGATFDFLAGEAKRAPKWMQRNGVEWLYRLLQDPSRLWKRYNRDFWVFGWHLVRDALSIRRGMPVQSRSVVPRPGQKGAVGQKAPYRNCVK